MTREEMEQAIKCCNPYDENCGDCPFHDLPLGRCFEMLAKTAFNMLLEDREKLQKQVKEYQDKIEQGTLIELPCKVGQDIYYITDKRKIVHRIAREYRYLVDLGWEITATLWETKRTGELCLRTSIIHSEEIGETAFFTREEAEQRLKGVTRMKNRAIQRGVR